MAAFIKRTRISVANPLHLQYLPTAHTPDYAPPKTLDWIMNPDLSGLSAIDKKYWETSGELVVEMDQAGKDAVDAVLLSKHNTDTEALIKSRLTTIDPLKGISYTVIATGLTIIVNINSIVVNDPTTVTADLVLDTLFQVAYIYNSTTDLFSVEVFQKTDGEFDDPAPDETVASILANYSLVPTGTDLVKI